ncbi:MULTISPECIES: alpha,alpha-phosphotrehalase [unclassified Arthrobacter]|uniref:alpha,alpha-phosphotrehalase n=1 Tax=unclassified Arthrobacter TaxID=235627 RepID=UPI001D155C5F|nr:MULTISPECIES: alpha,alpha-phosphotrehalase [unclassified Arthrobacter]MCC3276880.1 alpha,alpha-phosphotrehalase [Arthrobacter sp. zg-Y20]MCC9176092.1 alpha,alpha-phosphotrehalase [Arthrobacter sp. zg-Y750]MDK1317041.1 alpha,alpha-phosphotrehalase [Arthrobacter sp. zg.Y20]MDK1327217.1 alpha,alpha-phosphotrehalase [Arthrobacter sp. zg-Y1143]WIB05248.1 alpha,alpha-phosphotrehalase [Arthrobacter sp. zg-Y20]
MENPNRPAWWANAVVYQIYPRSFADSTGDGVGDIGGIIEHLDHLVDLGIDVVWLSPVHQSPQYDNGYDISDYRRIDELFGTNEQFEELLGGLHDRGIKLVMDLVVNHTSSEYPGFVDSRSSRSSRKRDRYWWRDARPGFEPGEPGAEPNNWRSLFGGSAWTYDQLTRQYYLHLFAPQQPDLNWEHSRVREKVYEMMNWWLDKGVDGFRMDVINFISKDPALPDGVVTEPSGVWGDGSPYYVNGPRIHEYLQEMHRRVFSERDGEYLTVGETPGATVDQARLYTDRRRHELDMVFQFEHVSLDQGPGGKFDYRPLSLADLKTSWNRWQRGLAETGWNSLYLSNHDQPRVVSRFGDEARYRYESATMWATLLHLQRGTPYVFQGEEIGMTSAGFTSIDQYRDVESLNYYAEALEQGMDRQAALEALRRMSRDNARTPMQWTGGPNAGFGATTPWIPLGASYPAVSVEADRAAEKSVFRYYQRLIQLRHESALVSLGDFRMLDPEHPTLFAYKRTRGDQALLVLGNVSGDELGIPSNAETGTLVLGNYGDVGDHHLLRPWEARVLDISTYPGG